MALEYLTRVAKRRSVVFLVSDFISGDFQKPLRIASKKHDIVGIQMQDPRELELPKIGYLELEDVETGEQILLDTSDPEVRQLFASQATETMVKQDKMFKSMNMDTVLIRTDKSYIEPLMRFFRMRAKRFR